MKRIGLAVLGLMLGLSAGRAEEGDISLDAYTCAQFLSDVAKPNDAQKFLRSMMMIAWATGYSAAHQNGVSRGDTQAIQLIAAALGDSCRKSPTKTCLNAITDAVSEAVKSK